VRAAETVSAGLPRLTLCTPGTFLLVACVSTPRPVAHDGLESVIAAVTVCVTELRRLTYASVSPTNDEHGSVVSSSAADADLDDLQRSVDDALRWIDDVKKRVGKRGGVARSAQLDRLATQAQSLATVISKKKQQRVSSSRRADARVKFDDEDESEDSDVAGGCATSEHGRRTALMPQRHSDDDETDIEVAKQTREDVLELHKDLVALKDVSKDILALSFVRRAVAPLPPPSHSRSRSHSLSSS
jgi:hypothetical protein